MLATVFAPRGALPFADSSCDWSPSRRTLVLIVRAERPCGLMILLFLPENSPPFTLGVSLSLDAARCCSDRDWQQAANIPCRTSMRYATSAHAAQHANSVSMRDLQLADCRELWYGTSQRMSSRAHDASNVRSSSFNLAMPSPPHGASSMFSSPPRCRCAGDCLNIPVHQVTICRTLKACYHQTCRTLVTACNTSKPRRASSEPLLPPRRHAH